MRLRNKNCLLTGAGRGIGKAMVERMIGEGARVVGVDLDPRLFDNFNLPEESFFPLPSRCDVSVSEDVQEAIAFAMDKLGGIDVLINNAGIGQPRGDLLDTDEAAFDRIMAVNVRSIFLFARYGVPVLEKSSSPCIINLGSVIGLRPRPKLTWYSTSKGAANIMTQALSVELAPRGIRVNALCPVATETDMLSVLAGGGSDADIAPLIQSVPLGRLAKPSDVVAAAVFLASDEAAFLTGVLLPVDGGRSV